MQDENITYILVTHIRRREMLFGHNYKRPTKHWIVYHENSPMNHIVISGGF